jgi:hypothetical protein
MPRPFLAILLASIALGACATSQPEPTPVVSTFPAVAGPEACAQPIREFQTVVESDVSTGHLNADVHRRMSADLFGVRSHCAAGRTGPALTDLAEIKRRYGYR